MFADAEAGFGSVLNLRSSRTGLAAVQIDDESRGFHDSRMRNFGEGQLWSRNKAEKSDTQVGIPAERFGNGTDAEIGRASCRERV